jgi:hypothetical protein
MKSLHVQTPPVRRSSTVQIDNHGDNHGDTHGDNHGDTHGDTQGA